MNLRLRQLSSLTLPIVLFQMACASPTDTSSPQATPLEPERLLLSIESPPEVVPTAYWSISELPGYLAATDLNDAGEVVGHHFAGPDGSLDADFFWSAGTGLTLLTTHTMRYIFRTRINNSSEVAGTGAADGDPGTYTGYHWNASDGQSALPPLSDYELSSVSDLNADGYAVGASTDVDVVANTLTATLWTPDGSLQSLVTPTGFTQSRAYGINDSGLIVGQAERGDQWVPVLWRPGTGLEELTDLEDAVAAVAADQSIVAVDINEAGRIVGFFSDPTSHHRTAFSWSSSGLELLGVDEGLTDATAVALNESGQVVVQAYLPETRAWVWTPETGMLRLPGPDGVVTAAGGINRDAQVAGTIGGTQAVVWTPLASADDALDALTTSTEDVLTTAGLTETDGNGLRAKLDAIRRHLEHGRANAARNQLQAFINQVEAMVADGRLPEADGATLIAEAQALMALIE